MKSKYLQALIGLYLFIFLSALLQSCCREEVLYNGNAFISVYHEGEEMETDTVDHAFTFRISFEQEIEVAQLNTFSLMNSAYATSCVYDPLNKIDFNSLSITLDQSFMHDSNTLEAGYNLLELSAVDSINWQYHAGMEVYFTQAFYDQSNFENRPYTFTLSGNTNDGQAIREEKTLWIKN